MNRGCLPATLENRGLFVDLGPELQDEIIRRTEYEKRCDGRNCALVNLVKKTNVTLSALGVFP